MVMRKVRVAFLSGVLSLFSIVAANAQQDAQWSQYMFNSLYYNPGSAGIEGVTRLTFISRTKWLGYSPTLYSGGSPNTQIISANSPLPPLFKKLRHGAGFYMLYDTKGPLRNM